MYLSNILIYLFIGVPTEMVHGSIAIIKIFFMGTAVPAMLSYYFLDNSFIYIGASGAIQALIYAHLFIMTLQWARMENKSYAILRLVVIAFWLIQDNCWQLFRYYATAVFKTPISWLNVATSPLIGATYGAGFTRSRKFSTRTRLGLDSRVLPTRESISTREL